MAVRVLEGTGDGETEPERGRSDQITRRRQLVEHTA
jgi:hypothetical protein